MMHGITNTMAMVFLYLNKVAGIISTGIAISQLILCLITLLLQLINGMKLSGLVRMEEAYYILKLGQNLKYSSKIFSSLPLATPAVTG